MDEWNEWVTTVNIGFELCNHSLLVCLVTRMGACMQDSECCVIKLQR